MDIAFVCDAKKLTCDKRGLHILAAGKILSQRF